MTRKDYIIIAAALYGVRDSLHDEFMDAMRSADPVKVASAQGALMGWAAARDNIATALANENPRFDRVRFERASYWGD